MLGQMTTASLSVSFIDNFFFLIWFLPKLFQAEISSWGRLATNFGGSMLEPCAFAFWIATAIFLQ